MCSRITTISLYSIQTEIFFKNPPDGAGCCLKCIKSKNGHHFEKAAFSDVQLCFYTPKRYVHSTGP